ncbi:hypothetical protein DFS33DRAFT_1364599 [Desarmillaria ectypa]|nr:hypothetical protein DFS33DRAFT_1364599 [Desarmillaria ectypa]
MAHHRGRQQASEYPGLLSVFTFCLNPHLMVQGSRSSYTKELCYSVMICAWILSTLAFQTRRLCAVWPLGALAAALPIIRISSTISECTTMMGRRTPVK